MDRKSSSAQGGASGGGCRGGGRWRGVCSPANFIAAHEESKYNRVSVFDLFHEQPLWILFMKINTKKNVGLAQSLQS